ncbi:MAG: methionine--tRNA ligase [Dehalococcoidia bacterium]
MPERIFIGVAWPYANGSLHLGHLAGCYLPADIFARYHRLKGNQVLMVSGSDQHGTPITLRAEQEGVEPQEVVNRYHQEFLRCWEQMGIQFDLFTTTGTENHRRVVHDIFLRLQEQGAIYSDTVSQFYCPHCHRFLADRYVEGTCPHCGNPSARGDQCDLCGKPLNPEDLLSPRCRICGTVPETRETEHLFLKLRAFQERLLAWLKEKEFWRPSVLNFTQRFIQDGLRDRAITRDITWGVPVPLPGYETKRIYVWFEAVIGYLSAAQEWAQRQGDPDGWREFWEGGNGSSKSYYFIGKDNIPFHTIIWPAMLMGCGGLNLPYDVPANEFLTLEGRQLSTSHNWAVWLPDYLRRYEPDPLRYHLAATMPETGDSNFSWSEHVHRNNDELVATFGNLVHRVLTFTYRHFAGRIPEPGEVDEAGRRLLAIAEEKLQEVDRNLSTCRFRMALASAMGLAQEANRYIDAMAPWKALAENRPGVATSLWVTLSVINCLKTALSPFLPFSCERLHRMLGFAGSVEHQGWSWADTPEALPPHQPLQEPVPLFKKLDEAVVTEETQRLHTAIR